MPITADVDIQLYTNSDRITITVTAPGQKQRYFQCDLAIPAAWDVNHPKSGEATFKSWMNLAGEQNMTGSIGPAGFAFAFDGGASMTGTLKNPIVGTHTVNTSGSWSTA